MQLGHTLHFHIDLFFIVGRKGLAPVLLKMAQMAAELNLALSIYA